jgi:hypothetical protein
MAKLDKAIEEAKNGEAYQYFGNGNFDTAPQQIEV